MDEEPYAIVEVTSQTPSARGASTLIKIKARNLLTGRLRSESIKSGTKFDQPDLRQVNVQYLYDDGRDAVFMDQQSFEQFQISRETIGTAAKYLNEELKIKAMYFNNNPINVALPQHVELEVVSVEPGSRGNTASSTVTTNAELSNGVSIRVPLNIKNGDRILVDTTDDSFYQRA